MVKFVKAKEDRNLKYEYKTKGTCSVEILLDVDEKNKTINDVKFIGGCNGNTQGVSALVKGQNIDEVISRLKGIDCNHRGTSCPDQLAKALEEIKSEI